jgi:hypothetical protein
VGAIFEGLEQINWDAPEEEWRTEGIPSALQQVISSEWHTRQAGLAFLLGKGDYGPEFGYIFYSTTPAIVDFLIKLTLMPDVSLDIRRWLLDELTAVINVCIDLAISGAKTFRRRHPNSTLKEDFERTKFAHSIFDKFVSRQADFISLLHDPDIEMRKKVANLLGAFRGQYANVVDALKAHFETEQHTEVSGAIVDALAETMNMRRFVAGDQVQWFAQKFIENVHPELQLTFGIGYLENLGHGHNKPGKPLSEKDEAIYKKVTDYLIRRLQNDIEDNYTRIERYNYLLERIATRGSDVLVSLLLRPELDPEIAQVTVYLILDRLYWEQASSNKWEALLDWQQVPGLFVFNPLHGTYRKQKYWGAKAKEAESKILPSILNCDPFWQIPTNMLSFFFGLPDKREDFRAYVRGLEA